MHKMEDGNSCVEEILPYLSGVFCSPTEEAVEDAGCAGLYHTRTATC